MHCTHGCRGTCWKLKSNIVNTEDGAGKWIKIIRGTCSIIENWGYIEKQNLTLTLTGFFQLPRQSSASVQNNGAQTAATTATQLMGSGITSWRVGLASPQPAPEDLLRCSGACQFSLSLESHSRFIHDDANWKGIKLHILLTSGARSASRHPAWLAALQSLFSRRGQAPGNENSPTEKQVTAGLFVEGCSNPNASYFQGIYSSSTALMQSH